MDGLPTQDGAPKMPDQQRQPPSIVPPANEMPTPTRHLSATSATSSPLSSAPATPRDLNTPRQRPMHPATSPLEQHAPSPNLQTSKLRRTSSAMSLGSRPTSSSSPRLTRKGSRQSIGVKGEDEADKRPTPKRSISNLIANLRQAQSTMESIEEPIPLTAAGIATEHFARELLAHYSETGEGRGVEAETVVILHDACYGHRYSRLKSTKSTLSMIVERPERIHASVLGASAAYVRLGGHYAGGRNAPHPERKEVVQPPFKIRRTGRAIDLTSSYVTAVHGTSWMMELQHLCTTAGEKLAAGAKELTRSSTPTEPTKRKLHEGDLYLCPESLDAFQGALGGVAEAIDTIFTPQTATKRAFVAIRPPGHHCSADYPSGFCWLNNVHVGIEYAAQVHGLTHAVILDFDVHHGDGSQSIAWGKNSRNNLQRLSGKPVGKLKLGPDIGYYSLHDINSYPCEMGDDEKVQAASLCVENAHGQSVWNVHLQPWKTEEEFWELYATRYRVLLDKARLFLQHHTNRLKMEGKARPKAAIFISAGFDASEWEGAGMQRHKVNVPTEFYAQFTRDAVQLAQEIDTGCDGRVISVLEGGYSDRALCSGVMSHLSGLCASLADEGRVNGQLALDEMMNGLHINGHGAGLTYDKSWWSAANLTALEHKINPPPPPQQGKRVRTGPQPTFATPTESFAYKVVDPNKFARSISGTLRDVPVPARPPTPPAPEVDWVVATQELSKLLIPIDRQTKSCTAEELGGVRTKKDRQSVAPAAALGGMGVEETGKPRQLRDRKAKAPVMAASYAESAHSDEVDRESVRSVSRSSNAGRRQTVHGLPGLEAMENEPQPAQRRASRRLSAGSALSSLDGTPEEVERPPVPALPPAVPAPAVGMQIKKTRAPAKTRKAPGVSAPTGLQAPTSWTNASPSMAMSAPVSPNVSTFLANGQQQGGVPPPPPPTRDISTVPNGPAPQPSATSTVNGASNDLDALASGLKKISLKGPGSKEEHDRKLAERQAAERRARALKGAETRRVNAAAKKAALAAQGQVPGQAQIPPHEAAQRAIDAARDMDRRRRRSVQPQHYEGHASGIVMDSSSSSAVGNGGNAGSVGGGSREDGGRGSGEMRGEGLKMMERALMMAEDSVSGELTPADVAFREEGEEVVDGVTMGTGDGVVEVDERREGEDVGDETPGASSALPPPSSEIAVVDVEPAAPSTVQKAAPPLVPDSAARQLLHENDVANGTAPGPSAFTSGSPSSTRSPAGNRSRQQLPTFSSTGPIPFAAQAATATPTTPTRLKSPTSPTKERSPGKQQRVMSLDDGNGVSRTMLEAGREEEVITGFTPAVEFKEEEALGGSGMVEGKVEGGNRSIWDVPETPQKPVT